MQNVSSALCVGGFFCYHGAYIPLYSRLYDMYEYLWASSCKDCTYSTLHTDILIVTDPGMNVYACSMYRMRGGGYYGGIEGHGK